MYALTEPKKLWTILFVLSAVLIALYATTATAQTPTPEPVPTPPLQEDVEGVKGDDGE